MDVEKKRLGDCEVCGGNNAKYTCPKCEVKSCCVKCVRIHKKELECDGIRDKTKYVPISKFTNLDLLSDYRLLEDATRAVESLKKGKSKQETRMNHVNLPKRLFLLKKGLQSRNTTLHFLPEQFQRRKKNTTYLNYKTDIVYWRVEWIFVQAENLKIVDEKCDENLSLSTILNKYLNPEKYPNDCLKYYQSVGLNGINLFLKADMKQGEKYYQLEMNSCFKDCLRNRNIIEFPVLYVVFKDHRLFEIIDSDDEEMPIQDSLEAVRYVSKIVKEEEENLETSSNNKNLLFGINYTDEDLEDIVL